MQMWKYFLIAGSLLAACNRTATTYEAPVFQEEKEVIGTVLNDDMLLSGASDMVVDDNYIYFLSDVDGKFVHLYDKQTGVFVGSYVGLGLGPGELSNANGHLYLDAENQELIIYDNMERLVLVYSIVPHTDEILRYKENISLKNHVGVIRQCWYLGDDKFLVDGQLGEVKEFEAKRFQLTDKGVVIDEYNTFPDLEKNMAFISNVKATLSPSKNHFAFSTLFGCVLECYTLDGQHINAPITKRFYEPLLDFSNPNFAVPTEQTIYGFVAMTCTDDFIYSSFIGSKDISTFSGIAKFDWKGTPCALYKTDGNNLLLAKNSEKDTLCYALVYNANREYSLVSYCLE